MSRQNSQTTKPAPADALAEAAAQLVELQAELTACKAALAAAQEEIAALRSERAEMAAKRGAPVLAPAAAPAWRREAALTEEEAALALALGIAAEHVFAANLETRTIVTPDGRAHREGGDA